MARHGPFRGIEFGGHGTTPGKRNNPESIKFNSPGLIDGANLTNDRIQVFDRNGVFLTMWKSTGSGGSQFGNLHGIIIELSTSEDCISRRPMKAI